MENCYKYREDFLHVDYRIRNNCTFLWPDICQCSLGGFLGVLLLATPRQRLSAPRSHEIFQNFEQFYPFRSLFCQQGFAYLFVKTGNQPTDRIFYETKAGKLWRTSTLKEYEILRSPGSGASLLKTGQVYNYCAMRGICLLNRAIYPTFLPLYPRHSRVSAASTQPGLPDLGKPSLPPSPKYTATWRPFTATKFFTKAIFTAIFPQMGRRSLKH